jgi:hypothetical protein
MITLMRFLKWRKTMKEEAHKDGERDEGNDRAN